MLNANSAWLLMLSVYDTLALWCYAYGAIRVVRRRGEPVDFNAGTSGERVYLCYKRVSNLPPCHFDSLKAVP